MASTGSGRVEHSGQGYRILPHTADLIISAWAPTREQCISEAVTALAASFLEIAPDTPRHDVPVRAGPARDADQLVEVLDEAIYLTEAQDLVAVSARLAPAADGGLAGELTVVPAAAARPVGSVPKAVTRHGLRLDRSGDGWICAATIDV